MTTGAPCLWRSSRWPPLPLPPQFLFMEHLCSTPPASSFCCPMSLGFCVVSPSLAVVGSGTCSLFAPACAGLECLALLILTHHKLPPVTSAWLLLPLNSWLRDALQP